MKTLQEIQEENRRIILEAIYDCSYEEALEKELGCGCVLIRKKDNKKEVVEKFYCEDCFAISDGSFGLRTKDIKTYYQIIGKPIILSRVLLAVSKATSRNPFESSNDLINLKVKNCFINWDLVEETLEKQSEESQRQLHQLLTQ